MKLGSEYLVMCFGIEAWSDLGECSWPVWLVNGSVQCDQVRA